MFTNKVGAISITKLEAPNTTKRFTTQIELQGRTLLSRVPKHPRVTRSTRDCKGDQVFLGGVVDLDLLS
jgi:hypothetical protein